MLAPLDYRPAGFAPEGFRPDNAARHELLRRDTRTGPDTLVASFGPGVAISQVVTGTPNSEAFYWVRVVNRCGTPDADAVARRLRRVAFDDQGELILPVPNAPRALALSLYAGGGVRARWRYVGTFEETPPAGFLVYVATGSTPHDFNAPAHTVGAARSGIQDLGTFPDGTVVRVVVRSRSAEGAIEDNTVEVTTVADATAPAPVLASELEVLR
ncbi:MAG: hypothetical protein AAF797_06995 [Planctomycetota bacterium]